MTSWLEDLAEEAGKTALFYFHHEGSFTVDYKSDGSPVTTADHAVHQLLADRIRSIYPDDCILSEEEEDDANRLSAQRAWLIDPIDGTSWFMTGQREFATLVALWEEGRIVESVVNFPALQLMAYAKRGGGCFLNGNRVSVTQRDMSRARVLCWGRPFRRLSTIEGNLRQPNLGMLHVACGDLDGCAIYIGRRWGEHDLAAASLAIEEAGGVITDEAGQTLEFNKPERTTPEAVVCSNRLVHPQLLEEAAAALQG